MNIKKFIYNFGKLTDKKLFKQLGNTAFIRNGVGYGFISDNDLYHNCHIEIGIGSSRSGYGDWGGGFSHMRTSPLKIVIDKDYNIITSTTDSFYNSKTSQLIEQIAKKLQKKLGKKFIVENELLKECIDSIFNVMPYQSHIGLEVDFNDIKHTKHMLNYFTNPNNKDLYKYNFGLPNCLNNK